MRWPDTNGIPLKHIGNRTAGILFRGMEKENRQNLALSTAF
jgi:hypothetical protein